MTYIPNGRFNELEKYQGTYFQSSYNHVVRKNSIGLLFLKLLQNKNFDLRMIFP